MARVFGCLMVIGVMVLPVGAQTIDAAKWEVAFHGGGTWPTNPAGGTVSLPAPGAVFATASGVTNPPPSSRLVSSWYFGDGALLFNQAAASLAMQVTNPPFPTGRITTLDPVIGRSLGEWQSGGSIGVTVSRALTPRFSVEAGVDYGPRLQLTPSNSDAIEATRASFVPAFTGVIIVNANRVLNSVDSTATLDHGSRRQLMATGALRINLKTSGNTVPYATFGGGLISLVGDGPSVTLRGNYQFLLPNGAPINEIDHVVVADAADRHSFAGVLAAGVKHLVAAGWGIQLGVQLTIRKNTATTVIDTSPSVRLGGQPAGRGVLGAEPSIQFTNNSSDPVTALGVTAVAASTLTGPALTDFRTFSGSGLSTRTNLTAGVFWRF